LTGIILIGTRLNTKRNLYPSIPRRFGYIQSGTEKVHGVRSSFLLKPSSNLNIIYHPMYTNRYIDSTCKWEESLKDDTRFQKRIKIDI